jgi:hypothetical protein
VLPALLLAAGLLSGCGNGKDDTSAGSSTAPASSSAPATAATGSTAGRTPATGDDSSDHAPPFPANTGPDTGEPSDGAFVTVTDVRTGSHDGFDRVVFEVAGKGTPGWDARYVDTANGQARGDDIPVQGNAILQVTIRGVGLPTETGITEYDGSRPLPGDSTDVVTEVVWNGTFEGTSVAFVGTTQRAPFRVYLLENPARVVRDVVHPH